MANTDETSSNSFRDLVELWDDEDFIQYFTPDEIPEKVRTLLTEIQYMEDRIKYLTMEEEFDNFRIWRLQVQYDEKVRYNEELARRTAESVQLMKAFQNIEGILHPMFLDLKYKVFPNMVETANKLKAAKEAQQRQINEERDHAYEKLSTVKEIRLIEAEIAKIDQDIADTLAINKKLEQQYQEDIIKLAKMWKKQQNDELAAAALLVGEPELTPLPLYRHFTFSPDSPLEVDPEVPMELEIPSNSSNVSANKAVTFSLDAKTAEAASSDVKRADKRNSKQAKSRANGNSSQVPLFNSYTSEQCVKEAQSQPSFFLPGNSLSGQMSARSKPVEGIICSNTTSSSRDVSSNFTDHHIASSGSSFSVKPAKKSTASRRPSSSVDQHGSFDMSPSQNRNKTSSAEDFNFLALADDTTNGNGGKSDFFD